MTPLQVFLKIAQGLSKKPLSFWSPALQKESLRELQSAAARLIGILESKELQDTIAYKTLTTVQNSIFKETIDEVLFVQSLGNLVDVYRQAPSREETLELLDVLDSSVKKAKEKLLKYHIALEGLVKRGKKMKEEEKTKSDQKVIQEVGLFYVLEYTLQVLFEFTQISDEDKWKLLKEGLQVKAGNLPAYLPLEDSFRDDLCLRIFDPEMRDKLLNVFYDFEEVLCNQDVKQIGAALKQFNLGLLRAFKGKGLSKFKAVAYAPFGNDLPIDELIQKVENVKM